MNPRQQAYFRARLEQWKADILAGTKSTINNLEQLCLVTHTAVGYEDDLANAFVFAAGVERCAQRACHLGTAIGVQGVDVGCCSGEILGLFGGGRGAGPIGS